MIHQNILLFLRLLGINHEELDAGKGSLLVSDVGNRRERLADRCTRSAAWSQHRTPTPTWSEFNQQSMVPLCTLRSFRIWETGSQFKLQKIQFCRNGSRFNLTRIPMPVNPPPYFLPKSYAWNHGSRVKFSEMQCCYDEQTSNSTSVYVWNNTCHFGLHQGWNHCSRFQNIYNKCNIFTQFRSGKMQGWSRDLWFKGTKCQPWGNLQLFEDPSTQDARQGAESATSSPGTPSCSWYNLQSMKFEEFWTHVALQDAAWASGAHYGNTFSR